jgi:hypothetical protein
MKVSEVGIEPKVTALVRMVIDPRIPGCSCDLPVLDIRSNVDVAISVSVR